MKKLLLSLFAFAAISVNAQTVGTATADSVVSNGFNITKELNADSTFMCYKGWSRIDTCLNTNFYYCSTNVGDTTFVGSESLTVVQDSIKSWLSLQPCVVPNRPIVITLE